MILNKLGHALIKLYEGYSSVPYLCPSNIPTIGFGNTRYEDGSKVTMNDSEITLERAKELQNFYLDKFSNQVRNSLRVKLNDNQFSALVSLAYNIGIGAFRKSTLLKKVNNAPNNFNAIEGQFIRWNKSKGRVLRGLTFRRQSEADLYREP